MAACFRVFLLVALNFYTIIVFHVAVAEAQTCIMGLPSNASLCTSGTSCGPREVGGGNGMRTRIIPAISFTCSGTVTGWRAAGEIRDAGSAMTNSVLSIWRERNSGSGTYDRISGSRIELGICGTQDPAPSVMNNINIYECILPKTVSVQPGYIVGIELPPQQESKFRLYFNSQGGQTNHVFDGRGTTFSLSQAISSEETSDQPQISLTIVPDIATTVLPTIQPSTTTEASSSMAGLTTQPPVTSTSMATTNLEVLTSIEASSTMTAATDPSTSTEPSTTALATGPSTIATPEASTTTMSAETQPSSTPTGAPTTDTAVTINASLESTTVGSTTTEMPASTTDAQTPIPPTGRGSEAAQPESDTGTVAGAAVGAIIAILLVLIIVLLLVLVLRRQSRNGQKFTPPSDGTIANPIYNDNIAIQVPQANNASGMIGVSTINSADHMPQGDYEDIDEEKIILPPHNNMVFENSMYDYSRPEHFEMSYYEQPVQGTMSKMAEHSFSDVGVLYVPSQEQRNSLSKNGTNGDVYSTIGMRQYSESGAAPKLFEEDETYWEPASDANELYKQLSTKKYREIVQQQIQITSHLGSGQFGTVSKGIWQSPMGAMDVAVKQLQSGASEEDKVKFLQEAAINGQFRHPNVVKLIGVVTVGEPTMIVLEMLSNGDLLNYLCKLQPSPGEILPSNTQQLLLKSCQQVASGMEYLARKAFVHRDLAARNILVADDKTCKISDFGMSRDLMDENYYVSHGGKVPVKWTAPEALHYKKYSTASDVWSYGCVMYEIWSLGHKPYEAYRNAEVIKMIDGGCRLPPPPGLPKELYKIMIQCWHPDRSSRPTFPQLVEMLSRPDFELFVWEEEDLRNSDPQVKIIGTPLEVAQNLYHELQNSYLNS